MKNPNVAADVNVELRTVRRNPLGDLNPVTVPNINPIPAPTVLPIMIPIVISQGKRSKLWDVEGKEYYDFLSAYSAVNQGHCHERIQKALVEQSSRLTLCSRAFYNDKLGLLEKKLSETFGYEMALCMNSGAEGVETAIKSARKWGYLSKGIKENEAIILGLANNFHGRTIAAISLSTSEDSFAGFGPLVPGLGAVCTETGRKIEFGSFQDIELAFEVHSQNLAGIIIEPIQGEAGVVIPPAGFLKRIQELCQKHNVLLVCDEIQTGLGRTGKMLASNYEDVKADVQILGKALSGGFYPVSAVLASKEVMLCIRPGEHGSTFGGHPVACAVAMEAIQVILDEKLVENAFEMGNLFRERLVSFNIPLITEVRGKGLLNAIELNVQQLERQGKSAFDYCLAMMQNGLLAKPTRENVIRLAPPLCNKRQEIEAACEIIRKSFSPQTQPLI